MEQCGLVAIFHHAKSFVIFAYIMAAWKVNDGPLGNDQRSSCEFLFLKLWQWNFIIAICLLTESMLIFFLNSQKCKWELLSDLQHIRTLAKEFLTSFYDSEKDVVMWLYNWASHIEGTVINEHISLVMTRVYCC